MLFNIYRNQIKMCDGKLSEVVFSMIINGPFNKASIYIDFKYI